MVRLVRSVLAVSALGPTLAAFAAVTTSPAGGAQRTLNAVKLSTVWLCRPGQPPDPCNSNRVATSVSASGTTSAQPATSPSVSAQKFDCFYVYPTVSPEQRVSSVCNVWAPMYHQETP